MNNRHGGHHDEHEERAHQEPRSDLRLSPAAQLQRSVGNARLLQLRALQRRNLEQEAREMSAARAGERQQEQLVAAEEQMTIPSGGQPLQPAVQAQAEAHLGVPMNDVRVVQDSASTSAIQAHAYTTTQDDGTPTVVLNSTQDPNSQEGKFTMMHELTHVAQQKKGMADGLSGMGGDDKTRQNLENHADEHAGKMVSEPNHSH